MTQPRKSCDLETVRSEIAALIEAVQAMGQIQSRFASDTTARFARLEALPCMTPDDMEKIKRLIEYVQIIVADAEYRLAMQRVLRPWRKFVIGMAAFVVAVGLLWDKLFDLAAWLQR